MTSLAGAERAALLDLLDELGPDAPTLCDGWSTHELAAHLVVRERRPHAVPGLVVPALHGVTERLEQRMRQVPYAELMGRLRSGPPLWSLGGALRGPLAGATDLHEFYVHHEDVRRLVDPTPRGPVEGLDAALWTRIRLLGPVLTARVKDLDLTLVTPAAQSTHLGRGTEQVVLRGTPRELFLWLFGRRSVAHVQLQGTAAARQAAVSAPLAW